ncbi:uncharacterized protein G2W53_043961 [Senna tora]|uniref:Uncharacterized protein n=1 Tax=Senna tora TaxID=362788 RepID=A0A834SI60_9FABA|nr:uncharacterized protein G2W53_043961 [Senna tora]
MGDVTTHCPYTYMGYWWSLLPVGVVVIVITHFSVEEN